MCDSLGASVLTTYIYSLIAAVYKGHVGSCDFDVASDTTHINGCATEIEKKRH